MKAYDFLVQAGWAGGKLPVRQNSRAAWVFRFVTLPLA